MPLTPSIPSENNYNEEEIELLMNKEALINQLAVLVSSNLENMSYAEFMDLITFCVKYTDKFSNLKTKEQRQKWTIGEFYKALENSYASEKKVPTEGLEK